MRLSLSNSPKLVVGQLKNRFTSLNFHLTHFFKNFNNPSTFFGIRGRGGTYCAYPLPPNLTPTPIHTPNQTSCHKSTPYNEPILSHCCTVHKRYPVIIKTDLLYKSINQSINQSEFIHININSFTNKMENKLCM